jgi:hypothetical protein
VSSPVFGSPEPELLELEPALEPALPLEPLDPLLSLEPLLPEPPPADAASTTIVPFMNGCGLQM